MRIKDNNLVFKFKDSTYNVPVARPWDVYIGNTIPSEEYQSHINKNKDTLNYIILHMTEKCNLRCTYCFEKNKSNISISKDTIDDMIQMIDRCKMEELTVRFFGGEPLLEVDLIEECINKINNKVKNQDYIKRVNYNLFTNATIVDERIINLIDRNNITLFISIDGNEKSHNRYRKYEDGQGSYNIVIKNSLTLLKRFSQKVIVRTVLDPNDIKVSLIDVLDPLVRNKFPIISVTFPWIEKDSTLALDDKKIYSIRKQLEQFSDEYLSRILNNDYSLTGIHPFSKIILNLINNRGLLDMHACSAGCGVLAVSADGKLYPCHSFVGHEEFVLGDVKRGIINNELYDKIQSYSAESVKKCSLCSIRYMCTHRCMADSLFFNNEIDAPNPYRCVFQKEILKNSFYIYHTLKQYPGKLRVLKLVLNKLYIISKEN